MTEEFLKEPRWFGVRFISGLLDRSPAYSLQLDAFSGDLYTDDTDSKAIEDYIPDYTILSHIEDDYIYPVNDAYFGYASRGCIRKCHFCGVPKLEGMQRDSMSISALVHGISKQYGEKRDLILMDNNVTASSRYKDIIAEIRDLGFGQGATLKRNGREIRRRVDFNQGVDARILCRDKMYLREMSTICISPLRIAFDHLGLKKVYRKAVHYASEFGITQLSNYMLYNFYDTPQDLYERLRINIDLNEELNVRIWSFPMRYQPVYLKDRSHVGEKWIWYWLRSFQVILQATHGVVSGNPEYFNRAFGGIQEDFLRLLSLPHHMIFHRDYYEFYDGQTEKEEYMVLLEKLTRLQHDELMESLSKLTSSSYSELDSLIHLTKDKKVKQLLEFYRPLSRETKDTIQTLEKDRKLLNFGDAVDPGLAEEERVEDAGLLEDEPAKSEKRNQLIKEPIVIAK